MVSTQQVLAVMIIPGVTWISRVSICPGHGPRKAEVLTHVHPAPVSASSMGMSFGVSLTRLSGVGVLTLLSESFAV